jgi:hypothetical protein
MIVEPWSYSGRLLLTELTVAKLGAFFRIFLKIERFMIAVFAGLNSRFFLFSVASGALLCGIRVRLAC